MGEVPARRTMSEAALTACSGANSPDINQVSFTPVRVLFLKHLQGFISGDVGMRKVVN